MITLKTFNSVTLSTSSQRAMILNANALPDANIALIEEARADSRLTDGYTVAGRSVAVRISISNYANRATLASALKATFRPGTRGLLVVTFDGETDYQMDCVVQSMAQDRTYPLSWLAILVSGQTAWRSVEQEYGSEWIPDGDLAYMMGITVNGNAPTGLSVDFDPLTLGTGGALHRQLYQLTNAPGYAFGNYQWCITLDTASLIGDGKMLATCYDLVVMVNGKPVNRWIDSPGSATAHIWFNVNIKRGASLTLKTSIDDTSEITSVVFDATPNNKKALTNLKKIGNTGIIVHGSEWIRYTGVDVANYKVSTDATSRGVYGTTKQAHSSGDTFLAIQNVIVLTYGDATATNPASGNANYDDTKPLFNLSSSNNTQWVWTTSSLFSSKLAGRGGAWKAAQIRKGTKSDTYLFTAHAASGNPALGLRAMTYLLGGTQRADTVDLSWTFKNPGLISSLAMTGRSYRSGTKWIDEAVCEYKELGADVWSDLWADATPGSTGSFAAWSHSVSVPNGEQVRLRISGQYTDLAKYILYEGLTATVGFVSANLPVGALLGEYDNYALDITLRNMTSGESIVVSVPMATQTHLTLDAEALTIKYNGHNAHDVLTLDDESRDVWLPLYPGAQTLRVEKASGTFGDIAIVPSWYTRLL
jgi:hypothetical protein